MYPKTSLALLFVTALLTIQAQAEQLVLNFDDLAVPNIHSCGSTTVIGYHGFALNNDSAPYGVTILNTTKTAACDSSANEQNKISPFGFATSSPNVAFTTSGFFGLDYQVAGQELINNASLAVGVQLGESQVSERISVEIEVDMTNFGTVASQTFTFNSKTDGPGPYQLTLVNDQPYQYLGVNVMVDTDSEWLDYPGAYLDTVVVESRACNSSEVCLGY